MKVVYTKTALENVDKSVAEALAAYATCQKKVQVACVSILFHAYNHGDYTRANTLVEGLKGLNQRALVEYFVKFGGLKVDEANGGFCGWSGKDYIKENFQKAKATMWWELKAQNPWQGFDLVREIERLIEKAEKAQKKAANDPTLAPVVHIDVARLDKLRSVRDAA